MEHDESIVLASVILQMSNKLDTTEKNAVVLTILFTIFCEENDIDFMTQMENKMEDKDKWLKSLADNFAQWAHDRIIETWNAKLDAFDYWELDQMSGKEEE